MNANERDLLLAERKELLLDTKLLASQVEKLNKKVRDLTTQAQNYCFTYGHEWKQVSSGSRGHYWNCKVCYCPAPGRSIDPPKKFHGIPKAMRIFVPPSGKKVTIHNPNRPQA